MVNVDVLSDTTFRDEAARALDAFAHEHGCPVARTQIEGLRQIAFNQPGEVHNFADHQREKAKRKQQGLKPDSEKYNQLAREIAFWDLIDHLCGSTNSPTDRWSLRRLAEALAPADCRAGKRPHGSAPAAEHQAYRDARAKSDVWHKRRMAEDYPAFFQRFCAHYLYLLSKQGNGAGRDQS